MNCQEFEDQIVVYLLGEADALTTAKIEAHLDSGCHTCRTVLDQFARSAELLSSARPAGATDAGERDAEIWQLIQGQIEGTTPTQPPQIDSGLNLATAPEKRHGTGIAVAATLLATACSFWLTTSILNYARDTAIAKPGMEDDILWNLESSTDDSAGANGYRLVSMHQQDQPTGSPGLLVVDPLGDQVHFYIDAWPSLAADEQYVLWFVTDDDQWLRGIVVDSASASGRAMLFDIPASDSPIRYLKVSIETSDDESNQQAPADRGNNYVSEDFGDFFATSM